jgi:hypothetical protein
MDRQTAYTTEVFRTVDFLQAQQNAMIAIAELAQAILGTSTVVDGFTCQPTSPASLAVALGAGQIYQMEPVEASIWSGLPATLSPQILKQGLALNAQNLSITPPSTVGFSQNFLIEVQYADSDATPVVLPYVNTVPPYTPLNGPAGSGASQNTQRLGIVAAQVKAGTAATTGTQTTPSADAGWTGLFVVSVAQGATTITSGNISTLASAPFISPKLGTLAAAIQSQQFSYGTDTGTTNALAVTLSPAPSTPPKLLIVKVANPVTGASTIAVNGTVYPLTHADVSALSPNDLIANQTAVFTFDGTNYQLPKLSALLPGSVTQANLARGAAPLPYVATQPGDNLRLGNDASAPTTTINVSAGRVRDDADVTNLELGLGMVKLLGTSWAAGGNAATPKGALDSGSLGNNQTLHTYLIGRLGLAVTQFSRTSSVVTLAIAGHGLGVGGSARIVGVGVGFDGPATITAIPDANHISYAAGGANVSTTSCGGTCDGFDILASQNYPTPALPSGWTAKQCLGSFLTDGSALIRAMTQIGDKFTCSIAALDANGTATASGARTVLALSVPTGVAVNALFRARLRSSSNNNNPVLLFTSLLESDQAPSETAAPFGDLQDGSSAAGTAGDFERLTNTSAQIAWRASNTGAVFYVSTYGWRDPRRRMF